MSMKNKLKSRLIITHVLSLFLADFFVLNQQEVLVFYQVWMQFVSVFQTEKPPSLYK